MWVVEARRTRRMRCNCFFQGGGGRQRELKRERERESKNLKNAMALLLVEGKKGGGGGRGERVREAERVAKPEECVGIAPFPFERPGRGRASSGVSWPVKRKGKTRMTMQGDMALARASSQWQRNEGAWALVLWSSKIRESPCVRVRIV